MTVELSVILPTFNERANLPVLFEKPGRHPGQQSGRSPYLQAVHCEGPPELIGRIAPVRIDAAARMSLSGTLLAGAQSA